MKGRPVHIKKPERFFCPRGAFWRVNRELLVSLGGSRALMMELAHPLVAAGVAAHSDFRRGGLGRLYRTARAAADLTFGTADTAHNAARHIHCCHGQVHGTLPRSEGPFPLGTRYQANDPHLRFWVLATLIDSSLLVYDLFVRPISAAEREDYYRDSKRLGQLLGIPPDVMPSGYEEFNAYWKTMLAGDLLTVTDTARELVKALFAPPLVGRLAAAASFVGIGLLPERLRTAYQFAWSDENEKRLLRLARISRNIRRLSPSLICVSPRALIAEWRVH